MKILQEDNVWQVSLNESQNFLQINWSAVAINEGIFKEKMQLIAQAVQQYKPTGFLANTLQLNFHVSAELQTWRNEVLFPVFKSVGLKKMAIVVTDSVFSKVSDSNMLGFEVKYFTQGSIAQEWLS